MMFSQSIYPHVTKDDILKNVHTMKIPFGAVLEPSDFQCTDKNSKSILLRFKEESQSLFERASLQPRIIDR